MLGRLDLNWNDLIKMMLFCSTSFLLASTRWCYVRSACGANGLPRSFGVNVQCICSFN